MNNNNRKSLGTELGIKNTDILITMVSYNRPLFLKEAVTSLMNHPGRDDFEFLIWDNGSNNETKNVIEYLCIKYPKIKVVYNHVNIGQQALHYMVHDIESKYFILLEDDMIWFQDNWLKKLVKAFETKPGITKKGKMLGVNNEWGIVATNVLCDEVNNGGMWKERFNYMIEIERKGIRYWTNIRAAAGAMIMRTKVLRKIKAVPLYEKFKGGIDLMLEVFDRSHYPMAHARDIYIYHAASPYFNELYSNVWNEKHRGISNIEESKKIYNTKGRFNFENKTILEELKNGRFKQYAEKLHKIFDNRRLGIHSFELN